MMNNHKGFFYLLKYLGYFVYNKKGGIQMDILHTEKNDKPATTSVLDDLIRKANDVKPVQEDADKIKLQNLRDEQYQEHAR